MVEPALRARAEHLAVQSREEGLAVPYLGAMPLFSGHRVYPGRQYDWVLVNLAEDPLFHDRDGFPIPTAILERLRAIERAGVDFDALYVAHELEKGRIHDGQPLTAEMLQPPPPKAVEQLSARLGDAAPRMWATAAVPLLASAAVSAAIASAAVMVGPALIAAAATCMTLDPILLCTIVAPGRSVQPGEAACWFYLSHWRYGEDTGL
jgi:hypothetical protein